MINFVVDKEKCIKCRQCVKECPVEIISMKDKNYPFIAKEKEEECIKCQHCLAVCPAAAISILGVDPEKSYQLDMNFPSPEKMELLIKGRRSIRKYRKENIDSKVIKYLLETAFHSPTAHNDMGVCFTVIDDYEKMEHLRELALNKLRAVIQEKKLPHGFEFFEGIMKEWDEKKVDVVFRDAPHMVIATCSKNCTLPVIDCVIALTNFEMLANTMGIGTVWAGLAKWLIDKIAPELKKVLDLPEDHVVGYMMLFGKPAVKFYRTVQKKLEHINILRRCEN